MAQQRRSSLSGDDRRRSDRRTHRHRPMADTSTASLVHLTPNERLGRSRGRGVTAAERERPTAVDRERRACAMPAPHRWRRAQPRPTERAATIPGADEQPYPGAVALTRPARQWFDLRRHRWPTGPRRAGGAAVATSLRALRDTFTRRATYRCPSVTTLREHDGRLDLLRNTAERPFERETSRAPFGGN